MISKAERQHIKRLKRWSADSRAAMQELRLLIGVKDMLPKHSAETVFDNVDWLIALIERELHTAGVKNMLAAVEAHEKKR